MRLALVSFVLITSSSGAGDEGPSIFTPAHFYSAGEFAFQKIIHFPETRGDVSVLLRCAGIVSRRGSFSEHSCFPLTEVEKEYAKYVDAAANQARLKAATVDGKTKWVWFQYLVRFERIGTKEQVRFYANWGFNFDLYGTNYLSAQPLLEGFRLLPCLSVIHTFFAHTAVIITADGKPGKVKLIAPKERFSERCGELLKEKTLKDEYVPAFHNGKPVDSLYVRPWWDGIGRMDAYEGSINIFELESDSEY